MWNGLVECLACSGRGWVPRLTEAWRKAFAADKVVDLGVARFGGVKEQCPRCSGRGRTLREAQCRQQKRKR
jgi:DnaJ-class molecular chaperone